MKKELILNEIKEAKKGSYVSLTKTKDLGKGIIKLSSMVVRLGVSYKHMKDAPQQSTGQLPWGEWMPGYEGYVIQHKGIYYLRVADGRTKAKSKTKYIDENGNELSRDEVISKIGASKLASNQSLVYCIKFDDIVNFGAKSKKRGK